ncbi:MAG: TetR/AcrR family transcriptional regulator [Muribaculaceae bacterium]|nr:TetR/AcrR family transcriptional regulator [Muribaculaceae bacterium]
MSTEEHIIAEAVKLLSRMGPQSMTMDMVARNCGISKRTLYETFPDKRTLIKECIDADHRRQSQEVKAIFASAPNCYDGLFQVYVRVRSYLQESSLNYVDELKRLYPEIFARQQEQEKQFVKNLSNVLRKAQDEGHVIKDINTDIAAFLFLSTMRNLHRSERLKDYGFKDVEVFDGAFLNFLRGMATLEGIDYIDKLVKQRNIK